PARLGRQIHDVDVHDMPETAGQPVQPTVHQRPPTGHRPFLLSRSSSARRTASSYDVRLIGTISRIDSSRATTSVVIESTRARPARVSPSVTSDSHKDESRGLSSGTGTIGSGRRSILATRLSMLE